MPIPRVQWKKIGGVLPDHHIEGHEFVIRKVKRGDEGKYLCIATNSKGSAEDHFKLRTTGKLLLMHVSVKNARIREKCIFVSKEDLF